MQRDSAHSSPARSSDFLLDSKASLPSELLVLAGLLLTLVLFRFQALLHIHSAYLGGSEADAGLYIWLLRSNTRDLFSLPWFNTQAFYPYSNSLAWSDNFILPSLVAWPFLSAGVPLVIVYNCILLTAHFLNGYATYRLCNKLTGKVLPSFVGGAIFMNYSTLTGNLGHPQLQFVFWLPLAVTALFSFFARPALRPAFCLGLLIFASFLCTVYYTLFILVAIAVLTAGIAILRPHQFSKKDFARLIGGTVLGALPLLAFVFPYFAVRSTFGEREIYEAYYFSATVLSYLSAVPFNFLYGATSEWSHAEANLFPGFAVFVLVAAAFPRLWGAKPLRHLAHLGGITFIAALVCTSGYVAHPWARVVGAVLLWLSFFVLLVLTYRMGLLERKLGFSIMTNRGLTAGFLLAAFVFFALSLGPLGNPEKNEIAVGVHRLFYEIFPGFSAIRAISRAGIFCIFFLCVVTAFSLSNFLDKKRRVATPLISMVLALGLLENYVPLYPLDAPPPTPPAVDYLASQSADAQGAVIALPLVSELKHDGSVKSWSEFARLNTLYMNWLFPSRLPLVNGYSGQRTKLMRELPAQVMDFPDQRSVNALRSIAGLRYILYVSSRDPGFIKASFEQRVQNLPGNLSLVMADTDGNYLFELSGSSRVRTDTYLLAPSRPPGVVYIELMGLYQEDGADIKVDIFALNHSQTTPIATATIKQNGQWERFLIELPETDDTVRPNWITFRMRDDATIFFRESRYKLAPD